MKVKEKKGIPSIMYDKAGKELPSNDKRRDAKNTI